MNDEEKIKRRIKSKNYVSRCKVELYLNTKFRDAINFMNPTISKPFWLYIIEQERKRTTKINKGVML